MTLKKKLISMIMVAAMLCLMVSGYTAMAADGSILIAADKEFVKKGETVTYTVSASGLSNIRGMQLALTYDADKASYVEDSGNMSSELFTGYTGVTYEDGKIGLAFALDKAADYTGVIADFTLRVSDDCGAGMLGMKVDKLIVTDDAEKEIPVEVEVRDSEAVSEYNVEFHTVPNVNSINIGDEITYTLSMSELNVKGMQFAVEYDDRYLELEKAEIVGGYNMTQTPYENKIGFVFYNKEDTTVSGELVSLKFKAKYVEKSIMQFTPIKVTGFMAVSENGEIDASYTNVQEAVSLLKTESVEISFEPDRLLAGEGETVSYTVTLNGINNYRGIQTALKYDLSKLEFISVEPLSIMSLADASFNTNIKGSVGIACVFSESTSTIGGQLAKINFRVKDNVVNGFADMVVSGTKVSADGMEYIDADYYTSVDKVYLYHGQKIDITASPSESIIIPGDTVTYAFDISDVTNFKGMQFKLNYDSDALEYISSSRGAALDGAVLKVITKTSDGVIQGMINYNNAGYTGSGQLFTVTFASKQVPSLVQPELYFSDFTADDYIVYDISPVDVYPTEPATEAINAIAAIGEVSLSDKQAIEYARSVYESLEDTIKKRVTNYNELVEAEMAYEALYAPIKNVIDSINLIGEVTLDSKTLLDDVNAKYEALTEEEKQYVVNIQVLTQANDEYKNLYDALPVFECTVGDMQISLVQNKPCSESTTLYIAQYDNDGAMTSVQMHSIKGTEVFDYVKTANTVRCFIWSDNMKPYYLND